jgi:hypothetical protein
MRLKKTLASYRHKDGHIVPQKDLDMHPLEEAYHIARWKEADEEAKIPSALTKEEEHDLMIESGADAVKQKRVKWLASFHEAQPIIEAARKDKEDKYTIWCAHQESCVAAGINPDTGEKLDAVD